MFGEFLSIVFKSIKLDKSLYSDNKNFGEAAIYFAGLIMILDGVAGAVAANTVIKTAVGMSGLTAILTMSRKLLRSVNALYCIICLPNDNCVFALEQI